MHWYVYITYIIVNILSIPVQLSFLIGAFMGVLNYSNKGMLVFIDYLLYILIVNFLNIILFTIFYIVSKKVKGKEYLRKHNYIAGIIFTVPTAVIYLFIAYILA